MTLSAISLAVVNSPLAVILKVMLLPGPCPAKRTLSQWIAMSQTAAFDSSPPSELKSSLLTDGVYLSC